MSSSRVHTTLTGAPPDLARQQRRLDREVALRLAAEAAAEQRACTVISVVLDAERLGDVVARAAGLCTGAHTSHLPSFIRAIAAGGSMVACARCGA